MTPTDVVLALLVVVIWGVAFIATKIGLASFSPPELAALRFVIASLPALFLARPSVSWPLLGAVGLTLFAGQFLFQFFGIAYGMPPGLASIVVQAQALFTILFAALVLRERPTGRQLCGTAVAFTGLALIAATVGGDLTAIGLGLTTVSAISWAIGNVLVKRLPPVGERSCAPCGQSRTVKELRLHYAHTMPADAFIALQRLWNLTGGEPAALDRVTVTGTDPILPTDFKIGTAASAVIAATALAATEIWRLRTGREQSVAVDLRAAVAAFRSERYLRAENHPDLHRRDPIFGFYQAGDGRWIQIHSNMPHHRDGALKLLSCEGTRESVEDAVAKWTAGDLENAFASAGLPTGMVRSRAEWHGHPQGLAVAELPLLEIEKIGEAPPEPAGAGGRRALSGVRVLDLTRVIAGPICGRTLAAYGADVLLVSAPHLPNLPGLVIDTGLGKLSASLDLRQPGAAEELRALVRGADVFCQSYRPGALARLGLAPEDLVRLRPGIVCVTLSAFGHTGPWRERRGFETIIQSVSGMAHEHGFAVGADGPQHLPAQVVDHGTGYLAALGALIALARRAREGGSYLVRVSLAQTGRWVDALGRVDGRQTQDLSLEAVQDLIADMDTPFGRLRHVQPAASLSETPAFWSRPTVPLGTHAAAWPA